MPVTRSSFDLENHAVFFFPREERKVEGRLLCPSSTTIHNHGVYLKERGPLRGLELQKNCTNPCAPQRFAFLRNHDIPGILEKVFDGNEFSCPTARSKRCMEVITAPCYQQHRPFLPLRSVVHLFLLLADYSEHLELSNASDRMLYNRTRGCGMRWMATTAPCVWPV
jgi:hypothetical protein